jgi:hypothetical protein
MKKNIMFGGWGAFIMKIVIKKFFIFLEIISKNGTKYCNQPKLYKHELTTIISKIIRNIQKQMTCQLKMIWYKICINRNTNQLYKKTSQIISVSV